MTNRNWQSLEKYADFEIYIDTDGYFFTYNADDRLIKSNTLSGLKRKLLPQADGIDALIIGTGLRPQTPEHCKVFHEKGKFRRLDTKLLEHPYCVFQYNAQIQAEMTIIVLQLDDLYEKYYELVHQLKPLRRST